MSVATCANSSKWKKSSREAVTTGLYAALQGWPQAERLTSSISLPLSICTSTRHREAQEKALNMGIGVVWKLGKLEVHWIFKLKKLVTTCIRYNVVTNFIHSFIHFFLRCWPSFSYHDHASRFLFQVESTVRKACEELITRRADKKVRKRVLDGLRKLGDRYTKVCIFLLFFPLSLLFSSLKLATTEIISLSCVVWCSQAAKKSGKRGGAPPTINEFETFQPHPQ